MRFYTRVREAVLGIEEIWVFLIESLFSQELSGGLIFDKMHKTMFKKEILNGHRYIAALIREIKESRDSLYDVLHQLEADLDSTYVEGMEDDIYTYQ